MRPEVSSAPGFEEAVDAALDECRRILGAARSLAADIWTKTNVFGRTEPVTAADMEVQQVLLRTCGQVLPSVPMIAEEDRSELGALPSTCVLIDPIDGTVPFLSGLPVYTISICHVMDGRPFRAVVDLPAYGIRVWAHAGRGIVVHGDITQLPKFGPSSLLVSPAQTAMVRDAIRRAGTITVNPVPTTSAKMVFVALSLAEAAIRMRSATAAVAPWDYAAAALIVHETGGMVGDDQGRDLAHCPISPVNGWIAYRRPGCAALLRQVMAGRNADAL